MIFVINDNLYFLIINYRRPKVKGEVEYTVKLKSAVLGGRVVERAEAGARYIRTAFN